MFGALSLAIATDRLMAGHNDSRMQLCVIGLIVTGFGGLIEVLQGAMDQGRSPDAADFIADAAGAFLALLLLPPLRRKIY